MVQLLKVWACGLLLTLTVATAPAEELIRNGNFEQGNKDFSSDYKLEPGNIRPETAYDIVTDPQKAHTDAASFGDHTSGKGNMMAVNGGNIADKVLWGQTVAVKPGSTYRFSLWLTPWYAPSPAQLEVYINGKSIGKITAGDKCGEWKQLSVRWDAGADATAIIKIHNLTTDFSGNDFCIDDISLQGPPAMDAKKPD